MACYHPIPAYQFGPGEPVQLYPPLGSTTFHVPCGGCIGCKTDRATEWARRAEHEARQFTHNSFVTLTYSQEHLPPNGELVPEDLRNFIKRLRRARDRSLSGLVSDSDFSLRYLASGEYGDQHGRPHYHILLFNAGFSDAYTVAKNLKESPLLAKLWTLGTHKIGTVTGASAAYVAQYTIKKMGQTYCTEDGEILRPAFLRVSLRPALGKNWLHAYKNDLSQGYLVTDGQKGRIPSYYKKKLNELDKFLAEQSRFKASQAPRPRDDLEAAERIHLRKAMLAATAKGETGARFGV